MLRLSPDWEMLHSSAALTRLPQCTAATRCLSCWLLAGAEDNVTPLKPADSGVGFHQITRLMPNARLEVLPECGHYPVIEQPELAAEKIRVFLG